jgi:predicted DNA-binding antitoxin AbrB/MazE fold protein
MTIHAIYENGVFRPLEAVELPDKAEVEISIQSTKPCSSKAQIGHPALRRLLEIADRYPGDPNSPTDRAAQHDHYLYGTPKRP